MYKETNCTVWDLKNDSDFLYKINELYEDEEACMVIKRQNKKGLSVNECMREFVLNLYSLKSSTEFWSMVIKHLLCVRHFENKD